ncbi:ABC transporter ATP-binding protein [Patulibacter defluvii]|uniref:ABC transporter ATP-binding protein n=1 Tax=Patulibacter defluvii TaxID=3095358 RepID=UPI002A74A522|nr:ABC transporter ATP-binding protein [Patulibacter sp. DM4]
MAEPALVVQDLHKTFRIPKQHVHTLKERALHPFRSTDYREYPVLREISFEVERGEFFGIVGRNGSGKSTLLKCMAGIYRPDQGRIAIAGRLAPFIELGVGFNPDLTALDNVVINGVMMGLSTREAKRRFDEIIEFAELGDFLDLKLKNYSSGMQVRLAFAVMVQASADVLLIDEVLAVGDAAFQQKCLDVFYRLRDEGRTIIFVTHDMSAVEQFCHRAMFLQDGDIQLIGDPVEVGRAYLAANFADAGTPAPDVQTGLQDGRVLVDVHVDDAQGLPVTSLPSGETVRLRVELEPLESIEHPTLLLQLRDADHAVVSGARFELFQHGPLAAGRRIRAAAELDVTLANGHYDVGVLLTQGSAETEVVVDARHAAELVVHSAERHVVGLVQPPTRTSVTDIEREHA